MNSHADYSNRRQVIVFATPDSQSGQLVQRSVEALRCQLIERDTDVRFVDLTELDNAGQAHSQTGVDDSGTLAQLSRLRGEGLPEFELVLIGKDGGVKARTDDAGALEEFLALIDTMPMRRAEMQSQDGADKRCE